MGSRKSSAFPPSRRATVDDWMNRFSDCDAMQVNVEFLTTKREGGVIWGFEIVGHQRQDRSQEALGLAKR